MKNNHKKPHVIYVQS